MNTAAGMRSLPWLEVQLEALVGNRLGAGVYRRWVEGIGLTGSERVLDIGTGAGACARHLARALPAGRLTCVDIDPRWLGIARRRMAGFGDRVELVEADAVTWSRPGAYHVVTAHFVLHDVDSDKRGQLLVRVRESLKPTGLLCLREPVTHGMTAEELQSQLRVAGLRPAADVVRSKVPLMGATIAGVWAQAG